MTDLQISGFAHLVMLILLLMRVPVGVVLGGVSLAGIWIILGPGATWGILTTIPYAFSAHWTLSSIPMFLLMGYVCYHAQLTNGLFRLARLWLSALPGGLAVASIGAASTFAAVTGSSVACAAAMGRIAVPEMINSGYDKGLASGVVAAAGTIGAMIPPSIILLLFGLFAEVPISYLFMGGIGPGLLTAAMYSLVTIGRATVNPSLAPRTELDTTWRERFGALRETWPVIALIIGVFGGLFSGIFTPTEAGAVGALLSFIIAAVKRTLTFESASEAIMETLTSTAAIFVIAIGANLLTRFLGLAGFTDYISEYLVGSDISPTVLILGISVVLLLLGVFLDPIGIMLLTLPIFLPVVESAGINLVWFGVLMAKFLEMALISPPVGLNMFVIKSVLGDMIRTETIFRGVLWYLAADLVTVALMIAFPQITLFLPSLIE